MRLAVNRNPATRGQASSEVTGHHFPSSVLTQKGEREYTLGRSLDYLIVRGAGVESRQELPRLGRDNGRLVVFARKCAHGIQGIEPHDRHEPHAIINVPTEQMDTSIALD